MAKAKVKATKAVAPECFLRPSELLRHETDSLQRMARTPWPAGMSRWKNDFIGFARKAEETGQLSAHVWFQARDPRAAADAPLHYIEIGALIAPASPGHVSYFIAIGEPDGASRRGLRKIDFDLDFAGDVAEPKPRSHSQVSGRIATPLQSYYVAGSFAHLGDKLDKPRIACLPKSFALLVHLALLEYQATDETIARVVRDATWISTVREAESQILQPHFDYCQTWFRSAANDSASLLSHFYDQPPIS